MFLRDQRRQLSLQERGAIIALHNQNVSTSEIADQIDCHRTTVSRWIKRHVETLDVNRKVGSGRPKSTTPAEDEMLLDAVRAKPITTTQEIKGNKNIFKRLKNPNKIK